MYEGEWTKEAIIAWAQTYSQKTIGRANRDTIKNFFRGDGIMVQLFVNETYVSRKWYEFQDYLWERVAEPLIANKVMKRMEEEGILLKREGRYILRALPALERLARGEGQ